MCQPGTCGAKPEGAQLVGPFTRDDYPQAIIDRPLTLPARMVEAEVGARFTSVRFVTPVLGVGGTDDTHGCRKRRLCTIARRFFGLTAPPFACAGCGP